MGSEKWLFGIFPERGERKGVRRVDGEDVRERMMILGHHIRKRQPNLPGLVA